MEDKVREFKKELTELVEEMCCEFKDDSKRSSIGISVKYPIELNGKAYNVQIDAFWEKSDWYEASTTFENESITIHGNF